MRRVAVDIDGYIEHLAAVCVHHLYLSAFGGRVDAGERALPRGFAAARAGRNAQPVIYEPKDAFLRSRHGITAARALTDSGNEHPVIRAAFGHRGSGLVCADIVVALTVGGIVRFVEHPDVAVTVALYRIIIFGGIDVLIPESDGHIGEVIVIGVRNTAEHEVAVGVYRAAYRSARRRLKRYAVTADRCAAEGGNGAVAAELPVIGLAVIRIQVHACKHRGGGKFEIAPGISHRAESREVYYGGRRKPIIEGNVPFGHVLRVEDHGALFADGQINARIVAAVEVAEHCAARKPADSRAALHEVAEVYGVAVLAVGSAADSRGGSRIGDPAEVYLGSAVALEEQIVFVVVAAGKHHVLLVGDLINGCGCTSGSAVAEELPLLYDLELVVIIYYGITCCRGIAAQLRIMRARRVCLGNAVAVGYFIEFGDAERIHRYVESALFAAAVIACRPARILRYGQKHRAVTGSVGKFGYHEVVDGHRTAGAYQRVPHADRNLIVVEGFCVLAGNFGVIFGIEHTVS